MATLYRSIYRPSTSRIDPAPAYLGEEVVFHGELAEALEAANALPLNAQVVATLETEHGDFHCNDFDRLTDEWEPGDKEFSHSALTIRVTKEALSLMHGDRLRYLRSTALLDDYLDEIRGVIRYKTAVGDVVEDDGKQVVIVDAADLS